MKLLTCSPVALLLLLRPGLASPTPAIDDSIPASSKISALEERQAVLAGIALGAYGIGFLTGKNVQEFLDEQKYSPGLDRAAGSDCFMSGSWTPKEPIRKLASAACDQMIPHALDFEKYGDPRRANPNVVFTLNLDGSPLINSEGYQQKITFGMFDQNGKNGADWLTKPACELAITSMLNDCHGDSDDTRGGIYAWGHDGVVAYSVDPTCVDSPGKKCGAHI